MGKKVKTASEVLTALDYYYDKQDTATKECLLALKAIILSIDKNIVHTRKYQIPFFTYHTFNLGFLWIHRRKVLVGFVEDGKLLPPPVSGRKKDKVITIEIDPAKDIPVDVIKHNILDLVRQYDLYSIKSNI
ncbi:MAG: DUF1801 domain-containing protein [Agriterribacter sp.]